MHSPAASLPAPFDFQLRTRLVAGAGVLARLGDLASELGLRRAMLVCDRGIVAAGHAERAIERLRSAGVAVTVYDEVRENPTTGDVQRCLEVAKAEGIDGFVGLGGGSSMDTAKGCNFLLTNGGEMKDYWGVGRATRPMLPLIAVPTTAGTGSECQSAALIADETTHQKMACLDPKAAARVALLDPELTLSQPVRVTACTGMDAIAHAVETSVTKKRTPVSVLFSREAFRLTINALPRVLADGQDVVARGAMQLGAAYAGIAIELSMLGAAHSMANPLTAHFGVVHGQAVGLVLPGVVRFNAQEPDAHSGYEALAGAIGLSSPEALAARLEEVLGLAGLASPLHSVGASASDLTKLADEAAKQWTANFNPRAIAAPDFAALYSSLL
jgi:alcohol dehydrogenase